MQFKKIKTTAVFTVVVFLLSGCGHKKVTYATSEKVKNRTLTVQDQWREREAKLTDIPVPLDSHAIAQHSDEHVTENIMLSYTNDMSPSTVIGFYEREMERCGWRVDAIYTGQESLLNFSKPTRFCSISVRPRYDVRKRVATQQGVGIFIVTGPLQIS